MDTAICLPFPALVLFFVSSVICVEVCSPDHDAYIPPPCPSQIYCYGQFLHDVQMSGLFTDSKMFVDMKLKYPEHVILANYEKFRNEHKGELKIEDIMTFIYDNMEEGAELEEWMPTDFNEKPSLVDKIINPDYKAWVEEINYISLNLSRKVKCDVKDNPGLYSFLYFPNGFLIAGGRFTELYYWDSYWIIRGLLLLDMPDTARGIIENFIYLFKAYGKIPNGSRKYYQERSQPPLLTKMVDEYYHATNDLDFVREHIQVIEDEFNYWMTKQTVVVVKDGCSHRMARYYAPSTGPRPESYKEDYTAAKNLSSYDEKQTLYTELTSTAESGWDFSSRWIIKDGTNNGGLSDTKTTHIIPVDLNSYLHYNALTISKFYSLLGNWDKASIYKIRAEKLMKAIHSVLWSEGKGIWFDYDIKNKKPREYFSPSNFAPVWTESYLHTKEAVSRRVLAYLKKTQADQFNGVPATMVETGLQWDFPNAWPPMQHILVEGLNKLGTTEAKEEARRLAEKWLATNYAGYQKYKVMFEKYDVTKVGETGGGGEYVPQVGFGWTNGLALWMMEKYCT